MTAEAEGRYEDAIALYQAAISRILQKRKQPFEGGEDHEDPSHQQHRFTRHHFSFVCNRISECFVALRDWEGLGNWVRELCRKRKGGEEGGRGGRKGAIPDLGRLGQLGVGVSGECVNNVKLLAAFDNMDYHLCSFYLKAGESGGKRGRGGGVGSLLRRSSSLCFSSGDSLSSSLPSSWLGLLGVMVCQFHNGREGEEEVVVVDVEKDGFSLAEVREAVGREIDHHLYGSRTGLVAGGETRGEKDQEAFSGWKRREGGEELASGEIAAFLPCLSLLEEWDSLSSPSPLPSTPSFLSSPFPKEASLLLKSFQSDNCLSSLPPSFRTTHFTPLLRVTSHLSHLSKQQRDPQRGEREREKEWANLYKELHGAVAFRLARLHINSRNFSTALRLLSLPDTTSSLSQEEVCLQKGRIYRKKGDLGEALGVISAALVSSPPPLLLSALFEKGIEIDLSSILCSLLPLSRISSSLSSSSSLPLLPPSGDSTVGLVPVLPDFTSCFPKEGEGERGRRKATAMLYLKLAKWVSALPLGMFFFSSLFSLLIYSPHFFPCR